MRLILLPISTRRTLIYAHRLSPPPAAQTSLADRVTARAAAQWRKWEAAEGGWQRKVTRWGNAAFARIPFQEWGLKSVPPLSAKQKQADRDDGKSTRVDVVFPPNVLRPEEVEGTLWRLATERQGLHRRSMWWSIAGLPITLPVGLIPMHVTPLVAYK
jgi:Mitochondrial K+-H+ exchange-related